MFNAYRGWVPTITGHISFSEIGTTRHPTPSNSANKSDRTKRFLICYQKRSLLDVLFIPNWLSRILLQLNGKFVCAAIGQSGEYQGDSFGRLFGGLFLIERKYWSHRPLVRRLREGVEKLAKFDPHNGESLADEQEAEMENLMTFLREKSDFYCAFELLRNGQVTLLAAEKHDLQKKTLFSAASDFSRQLHLVLSQLFIFFKDVSHIHKHHEAYADTILDIHSNTNDVRWRRETLYALYRRVINVRRWQPKSSIALNRALGIIAYASAFYRICEREEKLFEIPEYNIDEIRESMAAMISADEARRTIKSSQTELIFGWALSLLGAFIAISSLLSLSGFKVPDDQLSPNLETATIFLLHNPMWVILSTPVLGLLVRVAILDHLPIFADKIRRDLIRLFAPLPRWLHVGIWLAICFAAASISFFLLGSIVPVQH
jgi:hypothetical protein